MTDETKQTEAAHKAYQCRHLFADGHRCGSRALRKEEFCYYHHATRKPAPQVRYETPSKATFDLPFPEDRTSIQLAIGEIIRRLTTNNLDTKRAGLLLYALQIASLNLPKATPHDDRYEEEEVDEVQEIEDHPTLGFIAPITEYTPYERPINLGSNLLRALRDEAEREAQERADEQQQALEEAEEARLNQEERARNAPSSDPQILPTLQATAPPPQTHPPRPLAASQRIDSQMFVASTASPAPAPGQTRLTPSAGLHPLNATRAGVQQHRYPFTSASA